VAVGVGVGVAVAVGVAVGVGVGVGVGVIVAVSSTNTQSPSPALLFPGVVKLCVPVFVNGEPPMATNVSAVGSYQRAVTGLMKLFSAIVSGKIWLTGV